MTDKNNLNSPVPLVADDFLNDPRVTQAKSILLENLKVHQKKLTKVRPPDPLRKPAYQNMLATFYQQRGVPLWFPYLGSGMGNGALVELLDGSVKYDFISGIGPHCFGHSHPDIMASSIDAALSDTVMQGHLQQNKDTAELCELLTACAKIDHCFLTTSGAMANENAFKIAFQKKFPASRVLAFDRYFAGRTLIMSQVTDKPGFREGLPSNIFVDYVPFYNPSHPEDSIVKTIDALKVLLRRHPQEYALMCFELVLGEGGFYPGSSVFFKAIMSFLKEQGIAILIDEVQTFGRLPALFAFHYFGLEEFADIVTLGKSSQVCATLFRDEFKPKPGLLSQTFTGSTSAIKASHTIIKQLIHGGFFGANGKIDHIHKYFSSHLERLSAKYPHLIQGPFGMGSMMAFTPLGGEEKLVIQFVQELFQEGLIVFVAGSYPWRVRMLLPILVITQEDIDNAVNIIEQTLLKFAVP